jgi:hypothetical protein
MRIEPGADTGPLGRLRLRRTQELPGQASAPQRLRGANGSATNSRRARLEPGRLRPIRQRKPMYSAHPSFGFDGLYCTRIAFNV